MPLASPLAGAKDKNKDKDKDNSSKLYGEYSNIHLTSKQHGKLLAMCASEKLLNELINSFSVNIEVGKERPYTAELPNAHFERLKSYYNYRKKNPGKFQVIKRPETIPVKPDMLPEITEEDRVKGAEILAKIGEDFKKRRRGGEFYGA